MGENGHRRINTFMRLTHLYTGLFLAPWLLIYATSGFVLNHHHWIRDKLGVTSPKWEQVREVQFTPPQGFTRDPTERAAAILRLVDLEGPHHVMGPPNDQRMVINRVSGAGNYRVTWYPRRSLIVVQRQLPFSFYRLLHFLHFRHGYDQRHLPTLIWGVIVDVVTISMWLWVLTGLYIWFKVPRRRLLGSLCVIGGSVLFIVLVVLLCL